MQMTIDRLIEILELAKKDVNGRGLIHFWSSDKRRMKRFLLNPKYLNNYNLSFTYRGDMKGIGLEIIQDKPKKPKKSLAKKIAGV